MPPTCRPPSCWLTLVHAMHHPLPPPQDRELVVSLYPDAAPLFVAAAAAQAAEGAADGDAAEAEAGAAEGEAAGEAVAQVEAAAVGAAEAAAGEAAAGEAAAGEAEAAAGEASGEAAAAQEAAPAANTLAWLAQQTEGFSGSDLVQLCSQAAAVPIQEAIE